MDWCAVLLLTGAVVTEQVPMSTTNMVHKISLDRLCSVVVNLNAGGQWSSSGCNRFVYCCIAQRTQRQDNMAKPFFEKSEGQKILQQLHNDDVNLKSIKLGKFSSVLFSHSTDVNAT